MDLEYQELDKRIALERTPENGATVLHDPRMNYDTIFQNMKFLFSRTELSLGSSFYEIPCFPEPVI